MPAMSMITSEPDDQSHGENLLLRGRSTLTAVDATAQNPLPSSARVVSVACSTAFIDDRIVLVRELAEKADPFIKRRLLALAGNYEKHLSRAAPSNPHREIHMPTTFTRRPMPNEG